MYYEIATTATFTGSVRVCLAWFDGQVSNESKVRLFHHEGGGWVDITDEASRDPINNIVCGVAASLSPFTLFDAKYPFTGFFQPVDNLPTVNGVKAGSAVPVKFSLGGDHGLDIFAEGFPRAQLLRCSVSGAIDTIEETVDAINANLTYDSSTARYQFIWKTDKAWASSCRELEIKLDDGESYRARFTFSK